MAPTQPFGFDRLPEDVLNKIFDKVFLLEELGYKRLQSASPLLQVSAFLFPLRMKITFWFSCL